MSDPSAVLHVIDSLRLGGAERMAVELANGAVRRGAKSGICVTRSLEALPADIDPSVELFEAGRKTTFDWPAMRSMGRWIAQRDYQVIHGHDPSTFSLLAFMKGLGWLSRPVVFHDHRGAAMASPPPAWIRWGGHRLAAHYVSATAEQEGWARRAGFDEARISVIPNGIRVDLPSAGGELDLRSAFDIREPGPVAVVVANLRAEKGIDRLLRILGSAGDGIACVLVVGGDQDPRYGASCRELAEELGLGNKVRFLGSREDVPALMGGADLAMMPSRSESGPLALIEAFLQGIPVVAFDVGEVARRARNAGIPGIVDADAADAFEDTLRGICTFSAERRREIGEVGRKWAATEWDLDRILPDWFEVYRRVRSRS